MRRLRFVLARPWLFVRGRLTRRASPDLERLGAITDPERFVWAILPYAARTFAPSIIGLPHDKALVAAVGYLYARMLDTFEDLERTTEAKVVGLSAFAARFDAPTPSPAPFLNAPDVASDRDRVHLLLLDRCELVDQVYGGLPQTDRQRIASMIAAMSSDMQKYVQLFAEQEGRLVDQTQVEGYCRAVIGHPIVFILATLMGERTAMRVRDDAMDLSVLIQLANITRDIEADLERGIAYHPALGPDADRAAIATARSDLVQLALSHLPTYQLLIEHLELPRVSLARGSAMLMALHTDRHYRSMAQRCDMRPWPGPRSTVGIWARSLLAIVSRRATAAMLRRIERRSLGAPA